MTEHITGTISTPISKSRLEFLFDGIFAIAMTILVLEIKVPELENRHSVEELWLALARQGSTFFSYGLSLLMLGIFWYRHNRQYRHYRMITRQMLVIHLVQLGLAAFFPFCAALMGRYPINPLAVVIYIGCIMIYQWGSLAQWISAEKSGMIVDEPGEAVYRKVRKRNLVGCIFMTLLFLLYLLQIATS